MRDRNRQSSRRPMYPISAEVQTLESRTLLSGVVSVNFSSGGVNIRGDQGDNFVRLTFRDNGTQKGTFLSTDGFTSIRIGQHVFDPLSEVRLAGSASTFRNISVDLGAGNDTFHIRVETSAAGLAVIRGNLTVALGAGQDLLYPDPSQQLTVNGRTTLDLGTGDDQLFVVDPSQGDGFVNFKGDVAIHGGPGRDSVTMYGVTAEQNFRFEGGSGDDFLTVVNTRIGQNANLNLNADNDLLFVHAPGSGRGLDVGGNLTVLGGGGFDQLDLLRVSILGQTKLDGGSGDTFVDLGPTYSGNGISTFAGDVSIQLHGGRDVVYVHGVDFQQSLSVNLNAGHDHFVTGHAQTAGDFSADPSLNEMVTIQGMLQVIAGAGDDVIVAHSLIANGAVNIDTGEGFDRVLLDHPTLTGALIVKLQEGSDQLVLLLAELLTSGDLNGGDDGEGGGDTLAADSFELFPASVVVKNFEVSHEDVIQLSADIVSLVSPLYLV